MNIVLWFPIAWSWSTLVSSPTPTLGLAIFLDREETKILGFIHQSPSPYALHLVAPHSPGIGSRGLTTLAPHPSKTWFVELFFFLMLDCIHSAGIWTHGDPYLRLVLTSSLAIRPSELVDNILFSLCFNLLYSLNTGFFFNKKRWYHRLSSSWDA